MRGPSSCPKMDEGRELQSLPTRKSERKTKGKDRNRQSVTWRLKLCARHYQKLLICLAQKDESHEMRNSDRSKEGIMYVSLGVVFFLICVVLTEEAKNEDNSAETFIYSSLVKRCVIMA